MALAQEIITQTIADVKTFMETFAKTFISQLISGKISGIIDDAVSEVIPSDIKKIVDKLQGGDNEEEEAKDENADNKNEDDDKPIASGAHCVGYRNGIGPDRTEHRFYDLACWSIKPKGSMIVRVTQRHRVLLDHATILKKKIPNMPEEIFPKKKMGGKDKNYYKQRYQQIRQYYINISKSNEVTNSDDFLVFFRLKEDDKLAAFNEVFFSALEAVCEQSGISWESCKRKAERLGLDVEPVEMLKVVAVAKIGRDASYRVRQEVANKTPNFVPAPAKNKFINVAETKLAQAISSTIETSWEASNQTFKTITLKLDEGLDKALQPLKDLITKALEPIGKFVLEKFDKVKELTPKKNNDNNDEVKEEEVNNGPMLKIGRFNNFERFLKIVEDENNNQCLKDCGLELIKSVDNMMECWNYVCYLRYQLGAEWLTDWFPFISEIKDNHERLTICLCDAAYILTHAGIKSFIPLLDYIDRASKNYDDKQHDKEIRLALRSGGRSLAVEYFNLPSNLYRTLWYCGQQVSDNVLNLCQDTIKQIADLLGSIGSKWKPTDQNDVRKSFALLLRPALDEFVNDRVQQWLQMIQDGTQELIANVFLKIIDSLLNEVANTLNDACSALPDPLGSSIKAGDLLKSMAIKLAKNASIMITKKLGEKSINALYDSNGNLPSEDEWNVRRLRWSPIIKEK